MSQMELRNQMMMQELQNNHPDGATVGGDDSSDECCSRAGDPTGKDDANDPAVQGQGEPHSRSDSGETFIEPVDNSKTMPVWQAGGEAPGEGPRQPTTRSRVLEMRADLFEWEPVAVEEEIKSQASRQSRSPKSPMRTPGGHSPRREKSPRRTLESWSQVSHPAPSNAAHVPIIELSD